MLYQQQMIMEAPGVHSRGLLIVLLVPLFLGRWSGARGQKLEVLQSPGPLSVAAGETLTLTCTQISSGAVPAGGVRWHKGSDRQQTPIYSQKEPFPSRVIRVVPGSDTDFTINITDIRPEDAGTYYCVKYRTTSAGEVEEASGKGTEVSVIATPSKPSIVAPPGRVAPGNPVLFNCSAGGFSPREITVTWLKGGSVIQASETIILPQGKNISYRVWSTAQVQLTKEDVMTRLACRIQHSTVRGALEQSFSLADVLRVPPTVHVETNPPSPVTLNDNVTVTCNVQGFYPNDTSLDFSENIKNGTGKAEPLTQNRDGTFSVKSSLEVTATEERNVSIFTCLVRHNSQPQVNKTATLIIKAQTGDNGISTNSEDGGEKNVFIIVAVVCALLVLLVVAIIYFIYSRHNKGKDPTSVRLHESEKAPRGTNQDPDPNNVTYADLNFDKAPKKSPRQVVEISQQSEYASIQTAKPAASDDNVTYADLDMVHLSKAPKRPAPQPEEASSEYASVQVQSK